MTTSQQVVVVSKRPQLSGVLESMLDSSQFDVVLVESTEHAYSHIKQLSPQLIIVCLDVDDLAGFQVLSMLKLDSATKGIPVVTCTITQDDPIDDTITDLPDDVFSEPPAVQLN
jgi:DNA-binding response OmpR family regulator